MKIKRYALGVLWTNCYIVWDRNGYAVVVDPGGPAKEVVDFIHDKCLNLQWILLTHGHGDHIGGVSDLIGLSEHGLAIHCDDSECLTDANKNLSAFMMEPLVMPPADTLLNDGDILKCGDISIKVIHTPGHTLGCICLLFSEGEEQFLISGDTLFARSVGRCDLPGGDEKLLTESLKKLDTFPCTMRVFPGHGPETTIEAERMYNPYWPKK